MTVVKFHSEGCEPGNGCDGSCIYAAVLHRAPWDIERLILIGMYDSIGPYKWAAYRHGTVCRLRTKTVAALPRLNLTVI